MCDKTTVKNMLKGRSCDTCKFKLCEPFSTNLIVSGSNTSGYSSTADIEYKESCDVLGKFPKKRCCKFWKEQVYTSGYANTIWSTTANTTITTTVPITNTTTGTYTYATTLGSGSGGSYSALGQQVGGLGICNSAGNSGFNIISANTTNGT
jgi:hypothetical protein